MLNMCFLEEIARTSQTFLRPASAKKICIYLFQIQPNLGHKPYHLFSFNLSELLFILDSNCMRNSEVWLSWATAIALWPCLTDQKKMSTHEQLHTADQRTTISNAGPSEHRNQIQIAPVMGVHKTTASWGLRLNRGLCGYQSHQARQMTERHLR